MAGQRKLWLLCVVATASASASGQSNDGLGRPYKAASQCTAYKVDPLQVIRVGFTVTLAPNAVACRTPEAYEAWLKDLRTKDQKISRGLDSGGVCFRAPDEPVPLRLLQIVEAPKRRVSSRGWNRSAHRVDRHFDDPISPVTSLLSARVQGVQKTGSRGKLLAPE